MQNYFIDFETDGLDIDKCQVLQYAIIDEEGRVAASRICGIKLGLYQDPAESMKAISYNGYHYDRYCNRPVFSSRDLAIIIEITEGQRLWAHNSDFDKKVLQTMLERFKDSAVLAPMHCTMKLACKKFGFQGQTRMKLPQLMLDSTAHDAVDDAKNCWLLWQKCHGLGQFDPQLEPKNLDF